MKLICLKRVVKLTVTYSHTHFYFQFKVLLGHPCVYINFKTQKREKVKNWTHL